MIINHIGSFIVGHLDVIVSFIIGYLLCLMNVGPSKQMVVIVTLHQIVSKKIELLLRDHCTEYVQAHVNYLILMEHITCVAYRKEISDSFVELLDTIIDESVPDEVRTRVFSYIKEVNKVIIRDVSRSYFILQSANKMIHKVERL